MSTVDIWFKLSGMDAFVLYPTSGTPTGDTLLSLAEKTSLIIRETSDRIKELFSFTRKNLWPKQRRKL